jgi:hypothetical protein
MRLSQIPLASSALDFRLRARQDLNLIEAVEKRGEILAEIRFLGERDDVPIRVFSDDGVTTRIPFDENAYREFTQSIVAATKTDLMREIDQCNRTLADLGIEIDT